MKYFLLGLITLILYSCSALEGEQKTNVNDIIKSQEIKRVSRGEIMMHAERIGQQIEKRLSTKWSENDSCPALFSFNDSLIVSMSIESMMGFESETFESETERQTFEAYQYNIENGLAMNASTQPMGQDKVLYNFAKKLDADQMRNCPLDSTQSLVMWSLIIPIKSIVNSL